MLERLVQILEHLQQSVQDMGALGILAFAGIFVLAQMLMVPVSPLGMAFGLFFGFTQGWLGLTLGCAIGASINFLIARHLARAAVTRWLGANEKFRLIDSAVAREGWRIVALLRFVPIPFGLANYCYGLTPVRFWPYLAATCVAIIPANSLFVWMGSTFHGSLSSLVGKGRPHHPLEYVFLAVGIIAAVIALRYVSKIARKAIAVAEPDSP
jgi:uncharacterized membrane protein YdjX (TVP38/TMEM64 family)